MPLTRTNVGTFASAGSIAANTFTTTSFTPANNSLLVVCVGDQGFNPTDTRTITGGSLTWTKQAQAGQSTSSHEGTIWTAPVTTGASMTVTVGTSTTGASNEFVVHVFYYTGYNTSTPIGATASGINNAPGGGTVTITLSAAPALTSEVLGFMAEDTSGGVNNITHGTGWTEQFQTNDTANNCCESETRTNSTSTSVSWNTISGDSANTAIEILASAATNNPFLNHDWPNPNGFVYSEWQRWSEPGNNFPPFQNLSKPEPNFDWPNPPPVYWYRSWEKWEQQTPTVLNTFRQSDWPNPPPVYWYQHWQARFELTPTVLNTFRQSDWPNPQPVTWYQNWSISLLQSTLTPASRPPISQSDWPNPIPYQRLVDYTWIESGNSILPKVTVLNTFRQSDWPNPQPINWYQHWSEPGNVQLPFPTPFIPVDQPNPPPLYWYRDWSQNLAEFLQSETFPFHQSDWPNPLPVYWYRDYNPNLVIYLPVGIKPFNQSDWPLPGTYFPIDQYWAQTLALNLPPPPPPVIITSAGRWISPQEVISSIASKYGRIGGLASADSRTAAERSLLASIAAAHRWKK